ncbi:MAG: hypothetical protein KA099_11415, partial [Alphaproteobacteria bacterium]|nr:hypothetical protein [Alphaproteobacteria bacterium]
VRLGLVLAEIGKENKLRVADQELQRAVIGEAQKYPGQEKKVFDYYAKNRHALESLRAPLYEDKVIDFILELSSITTKDVTPEELMSAEEEVLADVEKSKAKKGGKPKKSEKPSESKKDGGEGKKSASKTKKASE